MADFYMRAGRALQDILSHRGSIKAITSGNSSVNDAKRVMALVVNTLSYKETLQQVLASVDIAKREPKWFGPGASLNRTADKTRASGPLLSECLLLVLVHDLLFASRGIQAAKAWPPKERLEKYKSQLHAELVRLQIRRKKKSVEELRSGEAERKIAGRIPRWCRVNTLKVSQAEAINQLQKAGFTLVDTETLDQEYVVYTLTPGTNLLGHGTFVMSLPSIRKRRPN